MFQQTVKDPQFERGIFTISLDFELIWGTLDLPYYKKFEHLCALERQEVLGRLLDLFAEFEISATWCTVGHLFLDHCGAGCSQEDGLSEKHPELVRSAAADTLRLGRDPGTSEDRDPVFYGRKLIKMIRECGVEQEIGSHGFSHVLLGDPECSAATARSEIAAAVKAATELGIEMRSFAFPRNKVGHLPLLAEFGFNCYRGQDEVWYESVAQRKWYHRAAHLADVFVAAAPPAVLPHWDPIGLWNIPGSMLFTPSFGARKFIPVSLRTARARKGLRAAARERGIFHMWFHPTDLVERRKAMLDGLRRVFETAAEMRAKGELDILSMGALAERLPLMSVESEEQAATSTGR